MTSLRDKFKATKIAAIQKAIAEEKALQRKIGIGGYDKDNYLKIEVGVNKFRIAPTKDGGPFYIMKVSRWITNNSDDNSEKPTYRRTVLCAIAHLGASSDPISEYVATAKQFIAENFDEDEATEKLEAITDWKTGLMPQTEWLCYAWKMEGYTATFGVLPFKRTVKDALNSEAMMEDPDEAIEVDPFTCPETGLPVIIKYDNKAKKAADYYKVKTSKTPYRLSDAQLEELDKSKTLAEVIKYNIRDFDAAIEGLQIFDDENDIGLMEDEDFLDKLDKLREEVESLLGGKGSDAEDDIEEEEEEVEIEEEEESAAGDQYSDMSREELKKVILAFIKKDPLAKNHFKLKKSMSEEEIADLVRAYEATMGDALREEEEENDIEEEEADTSSDTGGMSEVERLKAKLAKYKTS